MKKLSFLLFVFFIGQLKAQNFNGTDTIELARSKAFEKKFADADRLLSQYSLHDSDVNALRLHAQVLQWMMSFDKASRVFETALSAFPDIHVIKLDYGRMLFELGKLKQAERLLTEYLSADNKNAEANILLAQIYVWKGNIKSAKERLAVVLSTYPENETAQSLLREINFVTAPHIRIGGILASDDQPLNKTGFEAEAGWYHSWLFSPTLQFNFNRFTLPDSNSTYNSSWIQAGNKISFGNSGLVLNLRGGVFNQQTKNAENFLTGSAILSQKLSKVITLEAGTERRPYQFTSTSVQIPVMQQFSHAAIILNKNNKWLGRAEYQREQFEDNNKVQTAYLWILAPIVSNKIISIKAGYAFNHSNADINRFTSKKSINTLIQTTEIGGTVEGYYNPYFTPNNQTIHSLIGSIGLKLSDKINFTTRINFAVSASADIPVLILESSKTNDYSISRTFYPYSYSPIDFNNELLLNLSDRFSVSATYQYSRFLFYIINQGTIQLKYRFVSEKK